MKIDFLSVLVDVVGDIIEFKVESLPEIFVFKYDDSRVEILQLSCTDFVIHVVSEAVFPSRYPWAFFPVRMMLDTCDPIDIVLRNLV